MQAQVYLQNNAITRPATIKQAFNNMDGWI
jgi:hypothetical protein